MNGNKKWIDEELKKYTDMTDEELKSLTEAQLMALINDTLQNIASVFSSATKHISQLEEHRKQMEQEDDLTKELDKVLNFAKPKLKRSLMSVQDAVSSIYEIDANVLIPSNQTLERGKSYVEIMSQDARRHIEAIQKARDERYEEMIVEAEEKFGPIESPMDRLRK